MKHLVIKTPELRIEVQPVGLLSKILFRIIKLKPLITGNTDLTVMEEQK